MAVYAILHNQKSSFRIPLTNSMIDIFQKIYFVFEKKETAITQYPFGRLLNRAGNILLALKNNFKIEWPPFRRPLYFSSELLYIQVNSS